MYLPANYAIDYADLWSWLPSGGDWDYVGTPVLSYLQSGMGAISTNAKAMHQALLRRLAAKGKPSFVNAKTFNFGDFDYINLSITRTFIGKACPWEIQETLQLAGQLGLVRPDSAFTFCVSNLGVDCGGFVANYWGVGVPHLKWLEPPGAWGISPRSFWSDLRTWPDVMTRRRASAAQVRPGDAAVFFKDIVDDNPDRAKQRDGSGKLIAGTGSEAFHIGVVQDVGAAGGSFTKLVVAESSGARSIFGGNGVNVRSPALRRSGVSMGKWVYAEVGAGERIHFVAPPAGWGPELPYRYGEG